MLRVPAVLRLLALLMLLPMAAAAHTRPKFGGTLRVEVQGDAWAADSIARRMVYDSLTVATASGEVRPALAVRWMSTNNDHRWQFWIRPGVRFHDGSALTAESVIESLGKRCTQCPWSALRRSGDSVVFTFDRPARDLPAELAANVWAITGEEAGGAPGTGGFRLASNANGSVTLTAVDDAWAGRPYVDVVEITGRKALRSMLLDLATGQVDLVEIPAEMVRQVQQERLKVTQSGPCDLVALVVSRTGVLADDAQRESIAKAVDRAALANTIYQRQGELTADLLPNTLSGFGFLFPVTRDLARAQTLHGASGGVTLSLTPEEGGPTAELAAERLALNLRDAGFRVQVEAHDAAQPGAHADLRLRRIHLDPVNAGAVLSEALNALGEGEQGEAADAAALYREEASFLAAHTVVPLLWLPRSFGVGARVRELHLMPDGTPALADASLEDAR